MAQLAIVGMGMGCEERKRIGSRPWPGQYRKEIMIKLAYGESEWECSVTT